MQLEEDSRVNDTSDLLFANSQLVGYRDGKSERLSRGKELRRSNLVLLARAGWDKSGNIFSPR